MVVVISFILYRMLFQLWRFFAWGNWWMPILALVAVIAAVLYLGGVVCDWC